MYKYLQPLSSCISYYTENARNELCKIFHDIVQLVIVHLVIVL